VCELQLEGAVKGENGFDARDVLRLNSAAQTRLPRICEEQHGQQGGGLAVMGFQPQSPMSRPIPRWYSRNCA
jgi:hypothetical protein